MALPRRPDTLAQARAIMSALVAKPLEPHTLAKGKPKRGKRSNPKKKP